MTVPLINQHAVSSLPSYAAGRGRHLPALDGWRGLAILLVLIGHFWEPPGFNLGTFGVDLFFVLSGRLMGEILFVRHTPLPRFFLRRFSRVYPALLAFVLLSALAFHGTAIKVGWLGIAAALSFTINYAAIYVHHTGIFDHIWSLCVEEHAYVCLGLLALIARRLKPERQKLATALILLLSLAALCNGVLRLEQRPSSILDVLWRSDVAIAPIFLSAWLWLQLRQSPLLQASYWSYLSPLLLAAGFCYRSDLSSATLALTLGTACLAVAVCTLETWPPVLQRTLSFAPLRQLGLWSFSLYLWQQPFYKLMGTVSTAWLITGTLAAGLASYYLIERPSRRWLNTQFECMNAVTPSALKAAA